MMAGIYQNCTHVVNWAYSDYFKCDRFLECTIGSSKLGNYYEVSTYDGQSGAREDVLEKNTEVKKGDEVVAYFTHYSH